MFLFVEKQRGGDGGKVDGEVLYIFADEALFRQKHRHTSRVWEGDVALSAIFGMDGEEGLVGVDDVVRIVIETVDATVGE